MKTPPYEEFMTMDWEEIYPLYVELEQLQLEEDALTAWMTGWSDMRRLIDERYSRLSLAAELDTTDEGAEKAYHDFLEQIYPNALAADQKLKEKLLQSGLVPEGMEIVLKKMQTEADLFREENLPLLTEENKLNTQYNTIFGAQTVEWEEEELTLRQ